MFMTRNFKNDGTTINGLILLSTIDQLKLLGIVGSDILKGFNVSEIKSEASDLISDTVSYTHLTLPTT